MALAVHRTKIEELVAESVTLFVLREEVLQRYGELAEARSFGPCSILMLVAGEFEIGEEAEAAVGAFFETGLKLIGKDLGQGFELIGGELIARVHAEWLQ